MRKLGHTAGESSAVNGEKKINASKPQVLFCPRNVGTLKRKILFYSSVNYYFVFNQKNIISSTQSIIKVTLCLALWHCALDEKHIFHIK